MMNWIKDHKLEIGVGFGLIMGLIVGYKFGVNVKTVTQFTNSKNILKISPNLEWDTVDLFRKTKDGWDHIWAIDVGDAQMLSAELTDAYEALRPA